MLLRRTKLRLHRSSLKITIMLDQKQCPRLTTHKLRSITMSSSCCAPPTSETQLLLCAWCVNTTGVIRHWEAIEGLVSFSLHSQVPLIDPKSSRKASYGFTVSIGYFGLSLNTSRLHANPYLSCFIAAAVEVPSYISSWLALRYLPRRLSVICVLLLGGVSLYFVQLVPQGLSYLSIALEMLGKYGLTACTSLIFVYTAELYPTVLRNTATGVCATLSRVGSCIAPFVFELSVYFKYLPYILLGTLAIVSAFATFFLPESFGRPLPQTIEQMHTRERMKCPFITRK